MCHAEDNLGAVYSLGRFVQHAGVRAGPDWRDDRSRHVRGPRAGASAETGGENAARPRHDGLVRRIPGERPRPIAAVPKHALATGRDGAGMAEPGTSACRTDPGQDQPAPPAGCQSPAASSAPARARALDRAARRPVVTSPDADSADALSIRGAAAGGFSRGPRKRGKVGSRLLEILLFLQSHAQDS